MTNPLTLTTAELIEAWRRQRKQFHASPYQNDRIGFAAMSDVLVDELFQRAGDDPEAEKFTTRVMAIDSAIERDVLKEATR